MYAIKVWVRMFFHTNICLLLYFTDFDNKLHIDMPLGFLWWLSQLFILVSFCWGLNEGEGLKALCQLLQCQFLPIPHGPINSYSWISELTVGCRNWLGLHYFTFWWWNWGHGSAFFILLAWFAVFLFTYLKKDPSLLSCKCQMIGLWELNCSQHYFKFLVKRLPRGCARRIACLN